nr:hypothetical protein B0A51_00674 [Rachicladosporium sp. CCFEE 5018]
MASHPPGQCCTQGVRHTGEAKGEFVDIKGIKTYVSTPKSGDKSLAIIILPDVIGNEFINAQLISDQFAANNYYTVMPDLFQGDPVKLNRPEGFDIMEWLQKGGPEGKGHLPNSVDPIVEKTLAWMKEQGVKKVGAVGYCFGGKYVCRFLAKGKGVDVGYTAHPSFVDEAEVKGITGPLSIAAAGMLQGNGAQTEKRRQTEDILKEMKVPYQMSLYSDVEHGFAVRADLSKKSVKFAKEAAFLQAVQWFDEFLKGDRSSATPAE